MSPGPARRIGGYTLIEQLGSGGSGTVWRAIPDTGGAPVAFKLLHLFEADNEKARRQLLQETRLVNAIKLPNDAPGGIAQIIDVETEGVYAFIVSDLVPGPTLAQKLESGPLSPEQVLSLGHALAFVLERVHATRVAHRDLKPSNVILSERGPVLIDFGIARTDKSERVTQTGLVRGTPGFVAPEVLQGRASGFTAWIGADWYAFAALLLQSLTGRAPFGRGQTALYQQLRGQPDVDGLSVPLQNWFRAALNADPAERVEYTDLLAAIDADWRDDWAEDGTEEADQMKAGSAVGIADTAAGELETRVLASSTEDLTQSMQSPDRTLYLPMDDPVASGSTPTLVLRESIIDPPVELPPSFAANSGGNAIPAPVASSKKYGARSVAQNAENDAVPVFSSPASGPTSANNSGKENSAANLAEQSKNAATKPAKLREVHRIHPVPTALFCALISLLPVVVGVMGWAVSTLLLSGLFAIGVSYRWQWRKVRMGQEPGAANPLTLPGRMILGIFALIPGAAIGSIIVKVTELAGQAINGNIPANFQLEQLWDFLLLQTSNSTGTYLTATNSIIYWLACWFMTCAATMFPTANSARYGVGVIVDRFCSDQFQKILVWILLAVVVVLAGVMALDLG